LVSKLDAETSDRVLVRVLGPVDVEVGGRTQTVGGPRQRALLAHLIASGSPVRGSLLAEEMWGDPTATDSVKTAVSRLRRVVGADVIRHQSAGYDLDPSRHVTDVELFERHLARARVDDQPLAARIAEYGRALSYWRGPAFSDGDTEVCRAEAGRLTELRWVAIGEQIGARLDAGESADLIPELDALVAEHPWREMFTEQLMVALYRSRRQRDALAAYRRLETTLIEELGVRPNSRAQALHLAILEHDEARVRVEPGANAAARTLVDHRRRPPVAVGRDDELERLRRAVDRTRLDGRARVVVVAGPPGIGKSTLLDTFVQSAGLPAVVRAAGTQNDPIAFFTVGSVVGGLVARSAPTERDQVDLADLDLVTSGSGPARVGPRVPLDRDLRRLRLQHAIERLFEATLADEPLLVVIDDLHWVDRASMAVLGRLALRLADRPLTLLVSCRTSEMTERGPVSEFLADVCQRLPSNTIELAGLDEGSIRELVVSRGGEPGGAIGGELLRATGGNPFFVLEWMRHRADHTDEEAAPLPPTTVQETITERIDRLPPGVVDVLTYAAVVGQGFRASAVAAAVDSSADDVAVALLAAADASLTAPGPDGDTHQFVHALVRQVLLERLTPMERASRHAATARRVTGLSTLELANHLCQAIPFVETDRAATAALHAGDEAMALAAFEDAVRWYERALAVLDPVTGDATLRATALVGLGNALATGPESSEPRELFESAMALASERSLGVLYAQALLGRAQFGISHEQRDGEVARAREVLDLLGSDDDFLRVRVLLWVVWQLLYGPDHDEGEPYLAEAAELAERLGDSNSLAAVLQARHALLVAQVAPLDQRRAVRRRIAALPADRTRYEGSLIGGASVFDDLIEAGDLRALRTELDRYRRDADEIGRPYERWSARAIRFTVEMWTGDLDAAEAAMSEADALGQSLQIEVSRGAAAGQLLLLAWERDELPNGIAMLEMLSESAATPAPWLPPLALAYLEAGRIDDARRVGAELPDVIQSTVHRQNRAAIASVAAELVDAVRDDRLTATVETVLAPYAGRLRVSPTGVLTLGPYDRFLGQCALARDDLDMAIDRFDAGRLLAQKYELAIWEPRTAVWQAEALLRRGQPDDRELALILADEAAQMGEAIGSRLLSRLVDGLRARHDLPV
jgi:DNA-binding SARP family transcriptional activator/tetratricopeptide (TPR) repeat protein